jgi:endonuclease VIII
VPEGDTIFRAARTLNRALVGSVVTQFETVFPRLSRVDFDEGICGRTVEHVEARGKWLLVQFSGGPTLLTHMLMSGSWHIYRPGESWRLPPSAMRVMLATESIVAVAFNIQIAEFHTKESLRHRAGFAGLGPSLLEDDFVPEDAAKRLLANPDLEVGEALLKQSVVAGIGNVFKSEICFACGVHPFRKVGSLIRREAIDLMSTAQRFLLANVINSAGPQIVTYTGMRRTTARGNPSEGLWVYKRMGKPCRRCGAPIQSSKQGLDARSTFWCAQCQPLRISAAGKSTVA